MLQHSPLLHHKNNSAYLQRFEQVTVEDCMAIHTSSENKQEKEHVPLPF